MKHPLTCTRALLVAAMLLGTGATARAQTCDAPTSPIERVYVEVSGPRLDVLSVDVGQGAIPMTRDSRESREYRWFADLWNAAIVQPIPLGALTERMNKPGAASTARGWDLKRRADRPVAASEQIGNAPRCTAVFTYNALPVWRVQVEALPGRTPVLVLCPDFNCDLRAAALLGGPPGSRANTNFITEQINVNDAFRMTASFSDECTVTLRVTVYDLPEKQFSKKALYDNLSDSCLAFYSLLPRALASQFAAAFLRVPDGIFVREVVPR